MDQKGQKSVGRAPAWVHVLTAFIILLHGYDEMERGGSSYWFFYAAGLIFLLFVVFHHRLAARFRHIDTVFHYIEAVVLLVIAYEKYHHGARALPYFYLAAALGHIIAAIIKTRKGAKAHLE